MDKKIDRMGADSDSNVFQTFILQQLADSISYREGIDSSSCGVDVSGDYVKDNSHLLSLHPWIYRRDNLQRCGESTGANGDFSDKYSFFMDLLRTNPSPRCVSLAYRSGRSRGSLRSRRSQRFSSKQVTAMENCLIPQLYNEHLEFEDYVLSANESSKVPTVKPFIVTIGNRVLSNSSAPHLSVPFDSKFDMKVDGVSMKTVETVAEITPLPESSKSKKMKYGGPKTSDIRESELSHSQGPPNRLQFYCLGVIIGAMSTIKSNRQEIDCLNSLLKHSENLLQDLEEELRMKKSMTVKELTTEACSKQASSGSDSIATGSGDSAQSEHPTSFFSAKGIERENHLHLHKVVDNSVAMSKIEEELQAELQRLELT